MTQTWQEACREAQAQCGEYHQQILSLRAELAKVTAEREEAKAARERLDQDWKRRHSAWLEQQAQDVRAHAETRKALESSRAKYGCYKHSAMQTVGSLRIQLDSTRAELAKALENCGRYSSAHADVTIELRKVEARVKELEPLLAALDCCDWSGDAYGPDRAQLESVGQAFVEWQALRNG